MRAGSSSVLVAGTNHVRRTDDAGFPDETWRSHDAAPPDSMLVYRHEAAP